jgi:hypothetical protein
MAEYSAVEDFYLYRVESYLIHKYAPDLVEQFKVSFAKARFRRESFVSQQMEVFSSAADLRDRIERDLGNAPLRRTSENHHRITERPGIGKDYQDRFNEL